MIQDVNSEKLLRDAANVGFKPVDALGRLHSVMSHLTNLQPGNYVITHEPKLGAFVKVYQHSPVVERQVLEHTVITSIIEY